MDSGLAPDISVVIPARDASSTVARQLEAVCSQIVDRPFEVIVVDNGSTDGTADVVRQSATRFSMLRLIDGPSRPNRSAARNAGALAARGSVLAFCDADDVVSPGWLQALLNGLDRAQVVTGALLRTASEASDDVIEAEPSAPVYRGLACLASGNFAMSRALFLEVGGFSEAFLHRVDTELTCRLHVRGIRVAYAPSARIIYTRRATRWGQVRQHYYWAMAGVQIQKAYRSSVPLSYGWRNSVKHWLLVGPRLVRAVIRRDDPLPHVVTLATLTGQLVASIRYRTWAI